MFLGAFPDIGVTVIHLEKRQVVLAAVSWVRSDVFDYVDMNLPLDEVLVCLDWLEDHVVP
jgi:hypothetical protein